MAGVDLPAYPQFPQHEYQIELDGVLYTVTLTYRERTASWYVSLADAATGETIALGRRISPGSSPFTLRELPGFVFVFGADGYAQEDLGTTSLLLTYYGADEILDAEDASDLTFTAA